MASIDEDLPVSSADNAELLDSALITSSKLSHSYTDSGYATASSSPLGDEHPPEKTRKIRSVPFNLFRSGGHTELCSFDIDVDPVVTRRFEEIFSLFSQPLITYLRKSFKEFKSLSIRIAVLGLTQEQAKPWIVVFCDPTYAKRVRRFFSKKQIQDLCRPSDTSLYQFNVHVIDVSPARHGLRAATEIDVELPPSALSRQTSCGLRLRHIGSSRAAIYATLGGIVQATCEDGSYKLFGMSVGHLVDEVDNSHSWALEDEDSEFSDIDETESDDHESTSCPPSPTNGPAGKGASSMSGQDRIALQEGGSDGLLQIAELGNETKGPVEDLGSDSKSHASALENWVEVADTCWTSNGLADWCLFSLERPMKPSLLLPNQIPRAKGTLIPSSYLTAHTKQMASSTIPSSQCKDIVILTQHGVKSGALSDIRSKVLLDVRGFSDVCVVHMNDVLVDGDSGAWAIDPITYEVYGHVVASDILNDAYIVPLENSFAEMQGQLSVSRVALPTDIDVLGKREGHIFQPQSFGQHSATPPVRPASSGTNHISLDVRPSFDVPRRRLLHSPDEDEDHVFIDSGYSSVQVNTPQSIISITPRPHKTQWSPNGLEIDDTAALRRQTLALGAEVPPAEQDPTFKKLTQRVRDIMRKNFMGKTLRKSV